MSNRLVICSSPVDDDYAGEKYSADYCNIIEYTWEEIYEKTKHYTNIILENNSDDSDDAARLKIFANLYNFKFDYVIDTTSTNKQIYDIKVILNSDYFKNPPIADVYFNDILVQKVKFTHPNTPVTLNFKSALENKNTIKIHRYNKNTRIDTLVSHGQIIKDQTIQIQNIIVDNIPFESVLNKGIFWPDYPEPWATEQREKGILLPESKTYQTVLHFNGTWKFNFETPIHAWFFKQINISI